MPATALRNPWSAGDLSIVADHLQYRRKTAAAVATENPLLLQGEPLWEIDTRKGKIGDGVHRYNALEYSYGVLATGGSVTLPAGTIGGNSGGASGPIAGLLPIDARALLDVPQKSGSSGFDQLKTDFNSHLGAVPGLSQTATVTTVNLQPNVTSATALPTLFGEGQPISGTNIPDYAYVKNLAGDRKSFQLSSNPLSYVALNATGGGAVTATARDFYTLAHGLALPQVWTANPLSSKTQGFSGNVLPSNTYATRMGWEVTWYHGEFWAHSFENPVSQRLFPLDTYSPIRSHIVVPVPSAMQSWASFPTSTPQAFLNDTRYTVQLPTEGSTQARIVVDWMVTGATPGSGAKLKAQYFNGTAFVDLAENSPASTIEVALDTGNNTSKVGSWGAIDDAAKTYAAANGDSLLIRLVGFAASAAGTPTFGTVRLQFKP